MATPTPTQSTGEQRAATSVLAGPAFVPPTLGRIERDAGRLVDRVAPHGAEAVKSGPLAKLAWSDRVLGSYIGDRPSDGPIGRQATGEASPVSWLFPTPRHHDEIGWLSASGGLGAALPTALIAPSLAVGARAEMLGMAAALAAARTTAGMTRPSTREYLGPLLSALPALSYLSPDPLPVSRGGRGAMPPAARPVAPLPRPTLAPAPLTEDAPPIVPRGEMERAAELFAANDAAPTLAAGPNLFLPAGLGGAIAPSAHADEAPLTSTVPAAVSAIEAQAPAALDHLAWADRWLARFAGASPAALAALDAASSVRTAGPRTDEAPREAPAMIPLAAVDARVEDDERVPDAVFAAIAAARSGRPPVALPRQVAEPAAPTVERPIPPPAADVVLSRPLLRPGAGMQVELAASPAAPTLVGTMPMARGTLAEPGARALRSPITDIRALSPAALVTMASQAGREERRVAAPHLSWLSLPDGAPFAAATRAAQEAPPSARPGQLAAAADGFAEDRDPRTHGLSADYVAPELVLAARRFGFGPADALAARTMADGGLGELALGASAVDRVLVAANDQRGDRASGASHEPAPSRGALAGPAPTRLPRGAFLWPDASARALGVVAEPAPQVGAALELMAAHAVAGAAIAGAAVLGEAEGGPGPSAWPEFQALYLALGEEPQGRALAPAARAARALALVQRGAGPAMGSTERARMAWAALPSQGQERPVVAPTGERGSPREPIDGGGPERWSGPREVFVAPADAPRAGGGAAATPATLNPGSIGEALNALVVPSRPSEPARASAPAPAPAAAPSPSAQAAAPTGNPNDPMPAWMEEAARRIFAEGGGTTGSGGMSVAEMVLVSAAPRSQMAASSVRPDAPTAQSAATPQPGLGSVATANAPPPNVDVDRLAQEVYELVCRMLDIARERSGDPWQRM